MWTDNSFKGPFGEELVLSSLESGHNIATVVMFAGFTSKRLNATNTNLGHRLVPLGVRCVACDLGGHGDSEGDIADQTILKASNEISATVDYVRKAFGLEREHPIGVVGNSFSAAAAIVATARTSNGVSALALKSPVSEYALMRRRILGPEMMAAWKRDGYVVLPDGTRSNWSFLADALQVDIYAELRKIQVPVFAVQGSEDAEIPQESMERLSTVMDELDMEYLLIEGGDHNLSDPFFQPVIDKIAGFLTRHLGVAT